MISAQLEKTMRIIDRAANHPAFKTYRAVADYLGVSEGLISKIRKGKSNLQPDHVRQLAEAIGENVPAALLEEIGLQQETPRAQEAFSALARQIRGGGGVAAISDGYDLHLSDVTHCIKKDYLLYKSKEINALLETLGRNTTSKKARRSAGFYYRPSATGGAAAT